MTPPAPQIMPPDETARKLLVSVLLAAICLPELVITAADLGWIGSALWRPLSVQNAAFWPGLLRNWQPNYSAQPWLMFVSYACLHTGLSHMIGNALVTAWLAPLLLRRFGALRFAALWSLSILAGAAGYALLATGPMPMVGASGGVFGLFGAWVGAVCVTAGRFVTAAGITAGLVVLNIVVLILEAGQLAWQPHLAGYVAGIFLAVLWAGGADPA